MEKKFICLFLVIFLVVANSVYADMKSYVWTYEWVSLPKRMLEFEHYLSLSIPDKDKSNLRTWKYWLELEYGITDYWDVAVYQQLKQENKASKTNFKYDGFKLRTRYRLPERDWLFFNLLFYLEYIRDGDFSQPNAFEGKLILAKDIGRFNFSYNQILRQELETEGQTENEYSLGISYGLGYLLRVGLESKGDYTKDEYSLGPVISLLREKFWICWGGNFWIE